MTADIRPGHRPQPASDRQPPWSDGFFHTASVASAFPWLALHCAQRDDSGLASSAGWQRFDYQFPPGDLHDRRRPSAPASGTQRGLVLAFIGRTMTLRHRLLQSLLNVTAYDAGAVPVPCAFCRLQYYAGRPGKPRITATSESERRCRDEKRCGDRSAPVSEPTRPVLDRGNPAPAVQSDPVAILC